MTASGVASGRGSLLSAVRTPFRATKVLAIRIGMVSAFVVACTAAGRLALGRPRLALVAGVSFALCVLAAIDSAALGVLTVVGTWIIIRISGGGVDLSGSDALLLVTACVSIPFVPWSAPALRKVLAGVVVFQALVLITVSAHPTTRSVFEWGHRLFLTGGSVVVGSALVTHRRTAAALQGFLSVACAVGFLSVLESLRSGFEPAEVLGFHKNFTGSMLLAGLLIISLAPEATGLSAPLRTAVRCACALGLLASQSRGAIVALLVALSVAALRSKEIRRRSAKLFVVVLPLAFFAFFSLRAQLATTETATSSITERARYREQALDAWRESPVLGQGLRFFKSGEFALNTDPHNVIVASLSESGVVGLVALALLLGVTIRVLWRSESNLALAALTIVVARLTHGLFDIYWIAGTQTLPWLIVGMAVGSTEQQGDDRKAAIRRLRPPAIAASPTGGSAMRLESG